MTMEKLLTQDQAASNPTPKERIEAVLSFAFRGLHHLPGNLKHNPNLFDGEASATVCLWADLTSFDFDNLTRLVIAAHDQCVRVSIEGNGGPRRVKLCLWTRSTRVGSICRRHPTIEEHLASTKGREIWQPEAG